MNSEIERALWSLTWKLWRHDVPGSRRREIRRDLRANLREAAADVGEREAVRRLGSLDSLVDEYASIYARQPGELRLLGGLWWALATLLIIILLNGRRITSVSGLKDHGNFDPYSYSFGLPGGVHVLRVFGDVEQSVLLQIQIGRAAYLLLPFIAFLIGLRPWRLLERLSKRTHHDGASARV